MTNESVNRFQVPLCRWAECWAGLSAFVFIALGTIVNAADPSTETTAERLVQSALVAESKGDLSGRTTALRGAVQIAPDNKLGRWHLGQIEVNGQWLPVDEAQQVAAASPRFREYRALRESFGDSPEGQLALARWCERNGLADEARFHWLGVLSVQPGNEEALKALDAQWFNGRLVTRDELARFEQQNRETQRALRVWKTRVAAWQRGMAGDLAERTAALNEIRALDRPDAIPALEAVTLNDDVFNDLQEAKKRQISVALLDALDAMSDRAAVESITRHAVLSPLASVRNLAVERLKNRPLQEYVPLLLDGLTSPIETWFQVVTSPDGTVQYHHTLYREGPLADVALQKSRFVFRRPRLEETLLVNSEETSIAPARAAMIEQNARRDISANMRRFMGRFAREAMFAENNVTRLNESVTGLNAKIFPVLAQTSGQELGAVPRDWWNWWLDYNEYDRTQPRSVYCYVSQETYAAPPPHSCFAKGTLVATKLGRQPIETIRMGDMVLSQNVDTGELAYKPVIGTTLRPPRPMVKLTFGSEPIYATLGHPFWVAGSGWQMAKQLNEGVVLHGAKQPVRLAASEPAEEAPAYNLIVANFATYFVGEAGVLVHDNTMGRATTAIVPGLAAKSPLAGD